MYDVVIIGGGIIGLATGYTLLEHHPQLKLLIIEKESELALHQTGRNSGVIHSGIYYKPGSLKAKNCRRGVSKLLQFCENNNVNYELCGKVIVATTEEEVPHLQALYERGQANGVPNLTLLEVDDLVKLEPNAAGIKALHSPSTGIVDFGKVAQMCATQIEQMGGQIEKCSRVKKILNSTGSIKIITDKGDFLTGQMINCGGLYADRIARHSGIEVDIKIIPFRGEYFTLVPEKNNLVNTLIYPVPDPRFPFLGVHFTKKIDGSVEAGPNAVLAWAREGYSRWKINPYDLGEVFTYPAFWSMARQYWKSGLMEMARSSWKPMMVRALQRLVPKIRSSDLKLGGSGVRAQALDSNGKLLDDFRIVAQNNSVHVLNAPSPAATSAFAIAEHIESYLVL
ncbi:L-2-hydroxyglutarate oxidase [Candidatus Neomarinimicrobiota bacterium]